MKNISLPVITLRGMTVLPDMVIHFDISRKKSIHAVEQSMKENQRVFLTTQIDPESADPGKEDIHQTGTIAVIKQLIKMPNGVIRVLVEGIKRGIIQDVQDEKGMMVANVIVDDIVINEPDIITSKAMVTGMHELIRQYAAVDSKMSRDIIRQWLNIESAIALLQRFIIDYPMDYKARQQFLEMNSIDEIYENAAKILIEDTNVIRIREELAQQVKSRVDQNQKEYILREQLKVLQEELDGGNAQSEPEEFYEAVKKLTASDVVKEKLNKEIKRFSTLTQSSSEASVERTYIETLLQLPWDNVSQDNCDMKRAEAILEKDHYGLFKVKERILESLAVRNITEKGDATIICLVGPPGTGKTSIARSVARALNKEYVRICLGGVRDEAEIRGHRKTYIGAMPGRIIDGLKTAGVKNPLMLLDEIDKMSSDYKGDTASALLEVLDSEQNAHFVDHYVELPTDLSEVLFIATANDLSQISRPLLDRMEIIEVSGYTLNEKEYIAKKYLVPKQIQKNGLTTKMLKFSPKAINLMIDGYTREAGVRSLERTIAQVCRKAVRQLTTDPGWPDEVAAIKISDKNLPEYIGKVKFHKEHIQTKNQIGIVRGLAWTSVGGDTLEIEVNTMPGKGELMLTGQMGDVMQESARIALTYVRSIANNAQYQVDDKYFETHSVHLHIPEGAVPKDGPSAGVTMATALLSAIAEIPVQADVAMTGEVTLRGRVLPIGGLKEKLLAAKMAGVKTVLVPDQNQPDVEEFDHEILDGLHIVYVCDMSQVLEHALVKETQIQKKKPVGRRKNDGNKESKS